MISCEIGNKIVERHLKLGIKEYDLICIKDEFDELLEESGFRGYLLYKTHDLIGD